MNNSTPTPKKITLEDIAQRKQEVLQEICDQKQAMADTTRRIFAPLAPAASGGNALMRSFSTGMAIFDGVMLGMKMIRKVRGLFRKDIKKTPGHTSLHIRASNINTLKNVLTRMFPITSHSLLEAQWSIPE